MCFSLACFLFMTVVCNGLCNDVCNKTGFGSYIVLSQFIVSPLLLVVPVHFPGDFIHLIVTDPFIIFASNTLFVRFAAIAIFVTSVVSPFETVFVRVFLRDVGPHSLLADFVRSSAFAASVPGEMAFKGF